MIRVGITGSNNFLGQHLRWFLFPLKDEITVTDIALANPHGEEVAACDVIVHLASAHLRNTERQEDIGPANLSLARALTDACDAHGIAPHIIFASSAHVRSDNAYGRSKKETGEYLRTWAAARGATVTTLIIPNEFGEGGKPFDVSFVSTFCHQLARGERSDVSNATVSLIHAQDVAQAIHKTILAPVDGDIELPGEERVVAQVYELLREYHESYVSGIVPHLESPLHTALFNTLRHHLWENNFYPRAFELKSDERGMLFDAVREKTGGQTFISTTKPGKTRGNHYHTRKIERFYVVSGKATIQLRSILSAEVHSYEVEGAVPVFIDMPTFVSHNITNTGTTDLITAFWSNEILDLKDTDTYYLPV